MFIAVSGENIIGHDHYSHDEFNIEVPDQILIDLDLYIYKFKYINNELVEIPLEDLQQQKQTQDAINLASSQAKLFLDSSDWKVLRHIRQKALGVQTSLTEEEYLQLEQDRQSNSQLVI